MKTCRHLQQPHDPLHPQDVPPHSQGAPFFRLRHTASAAAARTTTITAIDETDIAGSSYAFDFLVTAQMQKISAAIATTVQTPNTPPEKSMPSW